MTLLAPQHIPEIEAQPCDDLIARIKAGGWLTEYEEVPPHSGDSYKSFSTRNKLLCRGYRDIERPPPTPAQQAAKAARKAARETAYHQRLAVYDRQRADQQRRYALRNWPQMFWQDEIVWITTLDTPCHIQGEDFLVNFTPHQHYLVPRQVAAVLINGNRAKMRPFMEIT